MTFEDDNTKSEAMRNRKSEGVPGGVGGGRRSDVLGRMFGRKSH